MNKVIKIVLILLVFACSRQTLAEGLYFDGAVGNVHAEETEFDVDGNDTYFRLGLGYEHSDAVSFEGGFWDLGEVEEGIFSASADGVFGAVKATARGGSVDFFGRVGLFMWDGSRCAAGFGCENDDGSDIFLGGGLSFDAGPGTLNVEVHVMELETFDVTTIGGSYSIPFGR